MDAACAKHPGVAAVGACTRCGDFICQPCSRPTRSGLQCADCAARFDVPPTRALGSALSRAGRLFIERLPGGFAAHLIPGWLLLVWIPNLCLTPGIPLAQRLAFLVGAVALAVFQLRVDALQIVRLQAHAAGRALSVRESWVESRGRLGSLVAVRFIKVVPVWLIFAPAPLMSRTGSIQSAGASFGCLLLGAIGPVLLLWSGSSLAVPAVVVDRFSARQALAASRAGIRVAGAGAWLLGALAPVGWFVIFLAVAVPALVVLGPELGRVVVPLSVSVALALYGHAFRCVATSLYLEVRSVRIDAVPGNDTYGGP